MVGEGKEDMPHDQSTMELACCEQEIHCRLGVPLLPEQDTLLCPNYQLITMKKSASTEPEETEDNEDMTNPAQQTSELRSRNSSKGLFPSL
ncbi:unnamed protein product [Brassica rapa]|uniref:Uncharacterized protein n=2 Tax=Brassica TaxID=3705 RepID=A0A8D9D4M4_BRACM|nr:unnamed protein product [Brassica napus]CAG7867774.1 unnamed protein product [Brassica rapa]